MSCVTLDVMVYSSRIRAGIGAIKRCFDELSLCAQDSCFHEHGMHNAAENAPLVLVACSGGRDSLALVALTAIVCASRGLRCGVVIVDHHMQPHSTQVAREAAKRCMQVGVREQYVFLQSVQVTNSGKGEESAARDVRYHAIIEVAQRQQAAVVLLAHTAHDQAETVLIGLKDSAGLEAVAGMKAITFRENVQFARPFIELTREQTTGICEDLGISWWDDPTNGDTLEQNLELGENYPLRSRIRHTLMPYISRFLHANMVTLLSRGATLAQDDLDYINAQVDATIPQVMFVDTTAQSVTLHAEQLAQYHPSIRRRIIARALTAVSLRFSSSHVQAIDELSVNWHGQKPFSLPNHYEAVRRNHRIVIRLCKDSEHANCRYTR